MKINKLMLVCILLVSACTTNSKSSDPKLELKETNPLSLTITNFHWSYSKTNNQVYGEFEALDHKVYDLLKGRDGLCDIYLEDKDDDNKLRYYGSIMIAYINTSKEWQTWHYKRGIAQSLHVSQTKSALPDSAKMDSVQMDTVKIDTATRID